MTRTLVTAIVSTAAEGAERGALDAAIEIGIGYGGRTSVDGHPHGLPEIYQARMLGVPNRGLAVRLNIQDSDGTLIVSFADRLEGRTKHAANQCKQQRKPARHLILPAGGRTRIPDAVRAALLAWIDDKRISVLHVVGPGEEHEPGIQQTTRDALVWVLEDDHAVDTAGPDVQIVQMDPPTDRHRYSREHSDAEALAAPESLQHVAEPEPLTLERFAELAERMRRARVDRPPPPTPPGLHAEIAACIDATGALTPAARGELEQSIRQAHCETCAVDEFLDELDECLPLDRPTLERLREAFYKLPGNGAGGSLHVVLDDHNWERESVEFCRKWAADRSDIAGQRFAELLLTLTDEQLREYLGAGYCGTCCADYGDEHHASGSVFDTPDRRCPDCGAWPATDGASEQVGDGIHMRIRSYANIVQHGPTANIDCSDMTDEQFAAMQADVEREP